MPTQNDVFLWLWSNWPSVPAAILMVKAYLKVRGLMSRIKKLEERQARQMDICAKVHPEHGAFLMRDKEGEE